MTQIDREGGWPSKPDLIVPDFPNTVLLDYTNVCNLSCIHCEQPHLRVRPGYAPRHMALDLSKKILDQVAEHPGTLVRIIGDGEPLVVPHLPEMVEYAGEKGISPLGITTAGYHLSEAKSRRFLEAGLGFIDFSLDAYSKAGYDQIRKGSNFERVIGNVNRFLELRKEIQDENYTGPRTKVLVNMIDNPIVRDEVADFKKHWKPLVDGVFVRPLHSVVGLVEQEGANAVAGDIKRWPCRYFWERLEVSSDGKVYHCSQAWGRDSAVVGDANNELLRDIWVGPTMQALRENHMTGNFPETSLCHGCQDWKTIKWHPTGTLATTVRELFRPVVKV